MNMFADWQSVVSLLALSDHANYTPLEAAAEDRGWIQTLPSWCSRFCENTAKTGVCRVGWESESQAPAGCCSAAGLGEGGNTCQAWEVQLAEWADASEELCGSSQCCGEPRHLRDSHLTFKQLECKSLSLPQLDNLPQSHTAAQTAIKSFWEKSSLALIVLFISVWNSKHGATLSYVWAMVNADCSTYR